MKKIAIFVEGQTEQFFINKLLTEIAGLKNIAIKLKKFKGTGKPTEAIVPKKQIQPINPKYSVLIYDCGGDESVKSRIIEEYQKLVIDGYLEVIGIRDLFPLTNLQKLENRLANGLLIAGARKEPALPHKASIIIAVHEIEAWFLSEYNHFQCIDVQLTESFITSNQVTLGFNPYRDDMTLRVQPSQDLKNIYQLVGKTYNKKKNNVEITVDCLDYSNFYLELRHKIIKLNELISKIDAFLT